MDFARLFSAAEDHSFLCFRGALGHLQTDHSMSRQKITEFDVLHFVSSQ